MTDAEISHKLALAIGYLPADIHASAEFCNVWHKTGPDIVGLRIDDGAWHRFCYADPLVIWPIAARYKCFPYHCPFDRPERQWAAFLDRKVYEAATPELAVALAVIGESK